jgi:hypothetical protein
MVITFHPDVIRTSSSAGLRSIRTLLRASSTCRSSEEQQVQALEKLLK